MSQQKHRRIQFFLIKVYKMQCCLLVYAPGVKPLSQQTTKAGSSCSCVLGHPVGAPSLPSTKESLSLSPRLLGEGRIQHRERCNTPGESTGAGRGSSYPLTSELMDPTVSRVGIHRHLVPASSVPQNSEETGSAQGHSFCAPYQI